MSTYEVRSEDNILIDTVQAQSKMKALEQIAINVKMVYYLNLYSKLAQKPIYTVKLKAIKI